MVENGIGEANGHTMVTSKEMETSALCPKNVVYDDEDLPEYDWEEYVVHQLQEILINNLLLKFRSAIKQVESGPSEVVVVGTTVRNCGPSCGANGLSSLAKYFVLEMTNMVLKARPGLRTTEALQSLLMSDLDLTKACSMNINQPSSSGHQDINENIRD